MKSLSSASFARAAMVGLLAAAQAVACTDDDSSTNTGGDGDGDGASSGGERSGTGGESEATGGRAGSGGEETGGAPSETGGVPGAAGEGGADGGAGGAPPVEGVTSTEIVPDLSLEEFTEMCDEAGGVVETHAVCGGVVSGPGFSYDDATHELTEHTCAGYNTCSGFSCVIDD